MRKINQRRNTESRRHQQLSQLFFTSQFTPVLSLGMGPCLSLWIRSATVQKAGRDHLRRYIGSLAMGHYKALGHWDMSTSNCLIFGVTSETHKLWHSPSCGCLKKSLLLHEMNFVRFLCHPYYYFLDVSLLAPNPGDAPLVAILFTGQHLKGTVQSYWRRQVLAWRHSSL